MRKTSVYLPEQTKAALHEVSVRVGRSEAALIRQAIDQLVRDGGTVGAWGGRSAVGLSSAGGSAAGRSAAGRSAVAAITGPRLIGVGVGPSAPDLITQRALDVLEQADRVFAASTAPDAIARSEAIVRVAAPHINVDRMPLTIGTDLASFESDLDASADVLLDALDQGLVVAFLVLGDPNVFSTFPALARRISTLRPDIPIDTVPGIMSFQELAAQTGTVLAQGDERVELVTMRDDLSAVDEALEKSDCTVVLYRGGRHLPEVAGRLRAHHRLEGAVVGEMMGLPGGRSGPVEDVDGRPASYLATVVIPATRVNPA
jgi:precorrin-2/cobalt-factor-2 C20-methyltransferase